MNLLKKPGVANVTLTQGQEAFLGQLPCRESHYNRRKNRRVYLSSDMNMNRLHKEYNKTVAKEFQMKRWMFQKVFREEFNIGFASPASDVCTLCSRLDNTVKFTQSLSEKNNAMLEKRVHKLQAKAFHTLMHESSSSSVTSCFDMQQVQVLPKLPIQEAFYARQVAYYCFFLFAL